jgi:glyoxylase-like metal-dependent hydrolase (beta-lactamase superfamily II)
MKPLEWKLFKVGHCRQLERLTCRTAPWGFCNFPALVALITHPDKGHILFDTGYSQKFFAETQTFPERAYRYATPVSLSPHESLRHQLAAAGIAQQDIRAVVLSHFHADHIAGVSDFPTAKIFCAKDGWDAIRTMGRFAGVRRGMIRGLLPNDFSQRVIFFGDLATCSLPRFLAPFERGYDLFGDGSLVAVPLPGHATGQFGLCFSGPDRRQVFLIADSAWSMEAVRNFTMPMKIANTLLHHTPAYAETLRGLHTLHGQNRDILIVPSHCRERQAELTAAAHV